MGKIKIVAKVKHVDVDLYLTLTHTFTQACPIIRLHSLYILLILLPCPSPALSQACTCGVDVMSYKDFNRGLKTYVGD